MDWVAVFADALRAAIGVSAAAYAIAAIGLNVHFGYTGLLNFGQVGFMMMGAYGMAATVNAGGPLWLGVIVGVLAAVLLGLLLGIPTLRLRADYLAIVTIAAAEILRLTARTDLLEPVTRGVFGIQQFAGSVYDVNPFTNSEKLGWGDFTVTGRQAWVMIIGWSLVAVFTFVVWLLMRSPWGRVLRSIREDEDAARSLGKNVFGYKLQSLVLGGVIGAFAGMLLAIDTQAVNPDTFVALLTFYAYTVLILGGAGRTFGPILGAIIFWFIFKFTEGFLDGALNAGWFPDGVTSTQLAAVRFALVGLGLMLLMIFRPQGILGNREELMLDDR